MTRYIIHNMHIAHISNLDGSTTAICIIYNMLDVS